MITVRLSDVVSVRGRFHRSVNLPRDWQRGTDLSNYIVTPTIRELADRILGELKTAQGTRSWSITGPYGSGKSAFALFLADLFSSDYPSHSVARELSETAEFPIEPFVPVLLVAERQSLGPVLKNALADALEKISPELSKKVRRSRASSGEALARLFTDTAQAAREFGCGGLLLVVDELGKFLEFAAAHPDGGDAFVLQQLAEAVERSELPILFVTILHSGFADYLRLGDELQRTEWQKIQGRFRDMPFHLPAEQMVTLVARALAFEAPAKLSQAWKRETKRVLASEALIEAGERVPLQLLHDCMPLHPITTLLLWPLFRSKAAQNERSLFAFLTSAEPFGLQDFLRTTWQGEQAPFLRPSRICDYVFAALGLAAFTGDHARKWSLIDDAVGRIPAEAPERCEQVVKTIGLLSVYGPSVGLVPSRDTLELAVGQDVDEALAFLGERSIVVYRKHTGGYALWEGSDVNLDSAFAEAQERVGYGDVVARLERVLDLRPVVARAHYVETGTLRFLDVGVFAAQKEQLEDALQDTPSADGRVVYAIAAPGETIEQVTVRARELTATCDTPLSIIAIPRSFEGIEAALRELECWTWVSRNVPALHGDSVARQEVRARIAAAQDRLERLAGRIFGLAGSPFQPKESVWVASGAVHEIASALEFQRWISRRCEETFPRAPGLHNELLNRQVLSSAAAAARRNLLERMVDAAEVERLGIDGTPAEVSMYESMLRLGGFHRERKGTWSLGRPTGKWRVAWDTAIRFVWEAKGTRRPVTELLERLRRPPFGIREGPLPVFLWTMLLAKRYEIALYEDGVFVPELRVEVIERLVRRPDTFELQSQQLDSHQVAALRALRGVIDDVERRAGNFSKDDFLPIVKSLILFASRLQPFAKKTRRLTPTEAPSVRNRLLDARDPRALLFEELPEALNVDLRQKAGSQELAERLRECLVGMGRAYPDLLDDIERQLRRVFSLEGSAVEARCQLAARSAPLVDFAADGRIRLFVREAAANRTERDWRESLARVLHDGLPPSHWSDRDVTAFQVRLQGVASEFIRLEEMVAEQRKGRATRVLRIGVLDGTHREWRAVIPLEQAATAEVADLANRVSDVLGTNGRGNGTSTLRLAALAQVAAGLLDQGEDEAEGTQDE